MLVTGAVGLAAAHTPASDVGAQAPVASDPAKSTQDHLVLAASYDLRLQDLDRLIAEHEQMKRDHRRFYSVNEKVIAKKPSSEMEKHCDAIIQDAKRLERDLRDFAAWHRSVAGEPQTR
ncbi:MAG: hypothetical protein IPK07_00140 [Deltaproteobacteria bacterium]|nr:hypothetical protein [Deltaproteobacteria bacterium]